MKAYQPALGAGVLVGVVYSLLGVRSPAPPVIGAVKIPEDTIMTARAAAPDLILHRGLFTTLDRANPTATAVAITDGKFSAVGRDA